MAFKARLSLTLTCASTLPQEFQVQLSAPVHEMLLDYHSSSPNCCFYMQTWGSAEAQDEAALPCACTSAYERSELWSPAHAALSNLLQHSGWAVFSLAKVMGYLMGMHDSLAGAAGIESASGVCSIPLGLVLNQTRYRDAKRNPVCNT